MKTKIHYIQKTEFLAVKIIKNYLQPPKPITLHLIHMNTIKHYLNSHQLLSYTFSTNSLSLKLHNNNKYNPCIKLTGIMAKVNCNNCHISFSFLLANVYLNQWLAKLIFLRGYSSSFEMPTCEVCLPASCLEPALPEAPLEAELSDDSMETLSLNAESLSGLSVRAAIEVFKFIIIYKTSLE